MLYRAGRKGKCLVYGQTEALRSTADLLGIFDFHLGFFFSFLFSNEYFLIIIYIKYVPNRLFCWMILSIMHLSGLCPVFYNFFL